MWAVVLDAGPESPQKLAFRVVQEAQSSKMQYRSIGAHISLGSIRHSYALEECLQERTELSIGCLKVPVDEVVDRLPVVGCCYY